MISRRFVLFVAAGGFAAAVNFGSRLLLSRWLDYVVAIVIAYGLGMVTAFVLNRAFVFEASAGALRRQIGWFVAVNAAAVLQTIAISLLFARIVLPQLGVVTHAETIAHAIGITVPVVTSYLGHKYLSFAPGRGV